MVANAGSRSGRAPVLAKYDVLEELGHGGMATVYRAHDKRLLRDVAIKVLHPHLRESREIAHRFSVEAKAVAKLRHPNIVEVFDVSSETEPERYLVVELVRGPTLRKILQDRGAIPPEIGAAIVTELLAGIAHAHESGVVHRDVKPENVLIEHRPLAVVSQGTPAPPISRGPTSTSHSHPVSADRVGRPNEGERLVVKLTDFGIAKLLDAQGVTSTGQVLGSPAHMAPEQIEGGDVDGRADVFGLGVLLYDCVVGHLPFIGNNPAQVLRRVLDGSYVSAERERPTVGKVWSEVIDRALARNPDDRFPDAHAMRDALVAELSRLGMGPPRKEIEGWLDDPAGWTAQHDARIIERLCQLGAASRKRSDAVAAAADYNRALAYAPNDPALLRIVGNMHRAEARARLVRRVGPLVASALVLGAGAYAVAKSVKSSKDERRSALGTTTATSAVSVASGEVLPVSSRGGSGSPATSTIAVAARSGVPNAATRTIATPTVGALASRVGMTRVVSFSVLRPSFGVQMTVDGAAGAEPDPTKPFTLDEKAHTLVFTCRDDLCTPKTYQLPAGEGSVELQIELAIANAKLLVEGDPTRSYGILEVPTLNIPSDREVEIPMTGGGKRQVHVFDRSDSSGQPQTVMLAAGKRATVSFKH